MLQTMLLILKKKSIEPSPEVVGIEEDEFVKGVIKVDNRLLILIDLAKILDRKELKV